MFVLHFHGFLRKAPPCSVTKRDDKLWCNCVHLTQQQHAATVLTHSYETKKPALESLHLKADLHCCQNLKLLIKLVFLEAACHTAYLHASPIFYLPLRAGIFILVSGDSCQFCGGTAMTSGDSEPTD